MKRAKIITMGALMLLISGGATVKAESRVAFHHEATDTIRLEELIAGAMALNGNGERIEWLGRQFLDTPYAGGTLNGDDLAERLTVNLDSVDCTTLVETVLALNATVAERRTTWRDFLFNLEAMRYRSGVMSDYASRLHYVTEWAMDNGHRGRLREVTADLPGASYVVKSLDFMSTHADAYPQLADSEMLRKIREVEGRLRNVRMPLVKAANVGGQAVKKALRPGDVVALVTNTKGLDVSHMGILVKGDGDKWHLLHASSARGKVVVDKLPLEDYLRRNRNLAGIRVFRP